ncbi:SnoaL-like polyketide cyclase [Streptomyces sp. CB00455]|uniref:ester cyclase n=1 Tax=Streptomyces sp. CB00455 TaxID=1703927 RepID=UPI000938FCE9|nr:ester cyclase [Streptomyces sp. CB00455]OKK20958.1 SnoaL-like polyketide cyclase [Streptomyces sp. CB00455]
MTFVQVIDYETMRFDEMNALIDRYAEQTSGRRTVTHTMIGRDRESRTHYVDLVEFPSYEEAMKNSQLPETDRMFQEMVSLCEGMPTFMNLDVVRDEHMNKMTANRVFDEILMNADFAAMEECFAADYLDHDIMRAEGGGNDRDGLRRTIGMWRDAFEYTFERTRQIAEGDCVTTLWDWKGTQHGEFMGVAPEGRECTMSGCTTFRFDNGLIAEGWWYYDAPGLMRQMGMMPG